MHGAWLLSPTLTSAVARALNSPPPAAGSIATASVHAAQRDIMSLASDGATEIEVRGVLTAKPEPVLAFFGIESTTYQALCAAFKEAREEGRARPVRLLVDSGGGQVAGLFECLEELEALRAERETSAVASLAASAAYGIAAAAGPIYARAPSSTFGSVGVAASYFISRSVVDITNTDSPDKRPDVSTNDGQAVVRDYLDQIFALFADSIARGRSAAGRPTSAEAVGSSFGRGRVMLARAALSAGLIDAVRPPTPAPGEQMANARRLIEAMKNTEQRPGESAQDYVQRVSFSASAGPDITTSAPQLRREDDAYYDAIAEALAERLGKGAAKTPPPPTPPGVSDSFADQTADALERLRR